MPTWGISLGPRLKRLALLKHVGGVLQRVGWVHNVVLVNDNCVGHKRNGGMSIPLFPRNIQVLHNPIQNSHLFLIGGSGLNHLFNVFNCHISSL